MSVSTTTHYGLKKPDGSEPIRPDPFNENAEVIDEQLYKNSVLTGTSAPTTSTAGAVGQFYLDTSAKILYQCMTQGPVYTWKSVSKSWKLLQSYTVAGSYTFTTPSGISELCAFIIGGGGAGACFASTVSNTGYKYAASGGGAGFFDTFNLSVSPGDVKNVVVGAGGAGVSGATNGGNGGTTSFAGRSVSGGSGGTKANAFSGSYPAAKSGIGGQNSRCAYNGLTDGAETPYGGELVVSNINYTYSAFQYLASRASELAKLFVSNPAFSTFNIAAGGSAYCDKDSSHYYREIAKTFPNGKTSSGATSSSSGVSATKGTDPGCGGGAVVSFTTDASVKSADGCDGAVLIYGR